MNTPSVSEHYLATKDSVQNLNNIRAGELWKVTRVDDDGDVWIELVNRSEMSQEQLGSTTYLDEREFWSIFRITGRDGEIELLKRQVAYDEDQVSRLQKQITFRKARLALMDKHNTDEAEASAIWDAISSEGASLTNVKASLGLDSVFVELQSYDQRKDFQSFLINRLKELRMIL